MFHPISKDQEGVKSCMKNCEAVDKLIGKYLPLEVRNIIPLYQTYMYNDQWKEFPPVIFLSLVRVTESEITVNV